MATNVKKLFQKWCEQNNLDTKKHQLSGIEWVINREKTPSVGSPGGFLCDEMGLGKTILMIGSIILNPLTRTLIVLPKSLLDQWKRAIIKFTPLSEEDVLIFHGANSKISKEEISEYCVVLTTYGMIATRKETTKRGKYICPLWNISWDRTIYDESHHLRNVRTGLYYGALKLSSSVVWMVTGTPINNKKSDFYNQCVIQGSGKSFKPNKEQIKAVIREIVLLRTKKQVGIKMPELRENIVSVEWESKEEEQFVRNIHSLMQFAPVNATNVDAVIQNLGNMYESLPIFMLMRQACVLPRMAKDSLRRKALQNNFDLVQHNLITGNTDSKLTSVVDTILSNRHSGKGKLVFCLFREEMEVLSQNLGERGMNSVIISGSTSQKDRKTALQEGVPEELWSEITLQYIPNNVRERINSYLQPEVVIAQIQTSCEGLNLQHLAEVYFTTPHWNPAVEDQAIARCHRIGQKKAVDVYRFVTTFVQTEDENSMSLDQYCLNVQQTKRECAKSYGF